MAHASRTYNVSANQLFETSKKAITNLGYDVDNYNPETGVITYHTGFSWRTRAGQDVWIMVRGRGPAETEIMIDAQNRIPYQIWDAGEGNAIIKKLLRKVDDLLQTENGNAVTQ